MSLKETSLKDICCKIENLFTTIVADVNDQYKQEASRLLSEEGDFVCLELQAAIKVIDKVKKQIQGDLRGYYIVQIRCTMNLSDECPIPNFFYSTGMTESNQILEKYFFEKISVVLEEQRGKEIIQSQKISQNLKETC